MSRYRIVIDKYQTVIYGYDRSFKTLFAALYDERNLTDNDNEGDERPVKAIGYHPTEQALTPLGTEYGAYPADLADLDTALQDWGVSNEQREKIGWSLVDLEPDWLGLSQMVQSLEL